MICERKRARARALFYLFFFGHELVYGSFAKGSLFLFFAGLMSHCMAHQKVLFASSSPVMTAPSLNSPDDEVVSNSNQVEKELSSPPLHVCHFAAEESPLGLCLAVEPKTPRPGDLAMFELQAKDQREVTLTVWDQEIKMFRMGDRLRAFAGAPLESSPSFDAQITFTTANDSNEVFQCAEMPTTARDFTYEELHVSRRFTGKKVVRASQQIRHDSTLSKDRPSDQPSVAQSLFVWPKFGEITAFFGTRRLFNHRLESRHLGVDIEGSIGERVFASQAGTVRVSSRHRTSGQTVAIDHGGGIMTHYLHLSKRLVKMGQHVHQGELIGLVGRTGRVTGPHLHFAVTVQGRYVDPEQVLNHPFYIDAGRAACRCEAKPSVFVGAR